MDIDSISNESSMLPLSVGDKGNIAGYTEHTYNIVLGTCCLWKAGTSVKLFRSWYPYCVTKRLMKVNKFKELFCYLEIKNKNYYCKGSVQTGVSVKLILLINIVYLKLTVKWRKAYSFVEVSSLIKAKYIWRGFKILRWIMALFVYCVSG